MAMEAQVTVSGPPLDVQYLVRLIEGVARGGPVEGRPGFWQWRTELEDIADRVISHSMEFPDLECEVEGSTVLDEDSREDLWLWVTNGNGTYERTEVGRPPNKRLPADIVYDTIKYQFRVANGKAQLVEATVFASGDDWSLDVTHYLR